MADRPHLPASLSELGSQLRSQVGPRALLGRLRSRLARADAGGDPIGGRALRIADQAERVLDRLDDTARILERVAQAELQLMERMLPIVDDLGQLVKLTLEETRQRVLGRAADAAEPRDRRSPRVIDVD